MAPPSEVWIHFTKISNGKKVQCSHCQNEFSYCGSTTTLSKHLKNIHKIDLCSNNNNNNKKRKRSDSVTIVNNDSDIESSTSSYKVSFPFLHIIQKKFLKFVKKLFDLGIYYFNFSLLFMSKKFFYC